jgi:hypothetical protein
MMQGICAEDWFANGRETSLNVQLDTYAALVEEEMLHVDVANAYLSPAIVWRKCAPVKAVIERVLALAGRPELKTTLDEAADQACFALCTLDDMLDWPDDYAQRRFTYPIQRAIEAVGESWSPARHDELGKVVEIELVYGLTHHALMTEVLTALEASARLVAPISPQLAALIEASHSGAEASWRRHLAYLTDVERQLADAL